MQGHARENAMARRSLVLRNFTQASRGVYAQQQATAGANVKIAPG
jgi:hypothetical protein